MITALIGHTGFVGSNLDAATVFDARYNSRTIGEMAGRSFDLVVCAGVSAVKWMANREPEADRVGIKVLTDALGATKIGELVLISTIDVYPDPAAGGDEATVIDPTANHAYGRHRYELEEWAKATFPLVRVVRLPALFGPGLRKNAIYDLLHHNQTELINPAGLFQWYPVSRLWADIGTTRRVGLKLVNLFTEPVRMREIIDRDFPGVVVGEEKYPAPEYRIGTRHAQAFGGEGAFIMSAQKCLDTICGFVADERGIEAVKAGATS
jgi:hypothetical protein